MRTLFDGESKLTHTEATGPKAASATVLPQLVSAPSINRESCGDKFFVTKLSQTLPNHGLNTRTVGAKDRQLEQEK